MATQQPTYDLVLLLDPEADEERRTNILASLETVIERQGEVVSRHDWGVRPTAYEVRKRADADYHLLQFHGTPELLQQLDHALKITDGVNRFRIIKLRAGTPAPPDLRLSAVRRGRRGAAHRPRSSASAALATGADPPRAPGPSPRRSATPREPPFATGRRAVLHRPLHRTSAKIHAQNASPREWPPDPPLDSATHKRLVPRKGAPEWRPPTSTGLS